MIKSTVLICFSLESQHRFDTDMSLIGYLCFHITLIRALRLAVPFWNHPLGVRDFAPPKFTTSKFEGSKIAWKCISYFDFIFDL